MSRLNDTISEQFFLDLDRIEKATRAENDRLVRLAQKGDLDARNELVERNMRFVVKMAARYLSKGHQRMDDAVQAGAMGLMEAVGRYEPDYPRRTTFLGYAMWWIRNEIVRCGRYDYAVSLPVNYAADRRTGAAATAAKHRAMSAPVSLSSPRGDGEGGEYGGRLQDELVDPEPLPDDLVQGDYDHQFIEEMLSKIDDERVAYVLRERFFGRDGEGRTLRSIGDDLGVSVERTRQLEARGLGWLRKRYSREGEMWRS